VKKGRVLTSRVSDFPRFRAEEDESECVTLSDGGSSRGTLGSSLQVSFVFNFLSSRLLVHPLNPGIGAPHFYILQDLGFLAGKKTKANSKKKRGCTRMGIYPYRAYSREKKKCPID
jgi:hypothetical protein